MGAEADLADAGGVSHSLPDSGSCRSTCAALSDKGSAMSCCCWFFPQHISTFGFIFWEEMVIRVNRNCLLLQKPELRQRLSVLLESLPGLFSFWQCTVQDVGEILMEMLDLIFIL